MTSTGGNVPQANSAYSCSHCGLMFESSTSLQVHMHYQHENQSRWGSSPNSIAASSTTTTTTDTENNNNNNINNNQPVGKHHIKAMSPHQNTIAAADSSDNNPPTPQPNENAEQQNSFQTNGTNSPFSHSAPQPSAAPNDLHHSYPTYPSYEGLYYHNMDYHQQEYKQTVPSTSRYNSSNTNSTSINSSVQITNNSNGLSPRIVSSSSPTHNASTPQNVHIMHISPGQPTPSPSPKQCDKCGVVCETDGQLIEHSQVAHSDLNRIKSENGDHQNYPPFPSSANPPPPPPSHHHNHYVKEEPSSDILDLDSQKMVYPHPDGALPPMHSLHPLQSIQRHSMIWGHHDAAAHFIPPHPGSYHHHHHQPIKPEYPPTPPINSASMKSQINDYSPILPVSMKQEYNHIKSEYNSSPNNIGQNNSLPSNANISKGFNSELVENGNSLTTTSPSDFPSTTTPQENGNQYQRSSFEPPSSTLPVVKSASWKSNEARRPKTYNCTACNKWFTSSGHLKRHYNTTLHKNAVKSSGQPDPATLPISVHHHPNRDPNYTPKRRSHHQRNQVNQQQQSQQQQQQNQSGNQVTTSSNQTQLQPSISSESVNRSPDYQPQFPLPSFGTSTLQQGFQQYGATNLHNASGNGQAGPSVQTASQLRGLPYTSISKLSMDHQQLRQLTDPLQPQILEQCIITQQPLISILPQSITTQQSQVISNINNLTEQQYPLVINTNIHSHYPIAIMEEQNYLNTIGNNSSLKAHNSDSPTIEDENQFTSILPSIHPIHMTSYDQLVSRYTGGAASGYSTYNSGDLPPFSPDIPEQYQHNSISTVTSTAYEEDAFIPQCATMAPSSPSISSTMSHIQQSISANTIISTSSKVSKKISTVSTTSALSSTSVEYRCDICDKIFNKSCYLTQHNKTFHSGEKPFKCSRCGKRFPCDASHEEHVAKHTGAKPFKCVQCPKAFNHKTDLRRHMCLHSGSKPYTCLTCGKGFIRKDHMVKHTETHTKKKGSNSKKTKNGKKRLSSPNFVADSNDSMQFQASE